MAFQLKDFAFATVMDVEIYPEGTTDFIPANRIAKLDSLTMSNITQEGPEKETRGGIASEPIIRFRKTVRLEMEDVVVTPQAMRALFGARLFDENGDPIVIDENTNFDTLTVGGFGITDTFAKMLTLTGKTFVIDRDTGDRRWIDITFKRFLPDSVLDMMMEAEGDLGIVNVAGELFPDNCGEYFTLGRVASVACPEEDPEYSPQ
jgi:hypothetical protein